MSNNGPSAAASRILSQARFEVMPTAKIEGEVRTHLQPGATVTVTATPNKGLEATLDLSTRLAEAGYQVIPHIAARMVTGKTELAEIVSRLTEAGITGIFVPGGDASPPAGAYPASLDLLVDLDTMDHPFTQVGIAGYPESHPIISDDLVIQAMWDKRRYATHIVSNMTFDTDKVASWVERMRQRGLTQPVLVGAPGPVERAKLLKMATVIGVGESMKFLKKQRSVFARIASPGFSADRFVEKVADLAARDGLGVEGLHLYTFNQVGVVEAWRRRMLEQLGARA